MTRTLLLGCFLCGCAAPASEPQPSAPAWQAALAPRARYFHERLSSSDEGVRLRLLQQLTYFSFRDSMLFPDYYRFLLKDRSPRLRWEGVHRLWEHGIYLPKDELPESFEAPVVGLVRREDVPRLRLLAGDLQLPRAGWAIHVLALLEDRDSIPTARQLLESTNVFVRFSAAASLIQLGEKEAGAAALARITDASDDVSGFYRYRAAESLVRLGKDEFLGVLVDMAERGDRKDYADGPLQILEDLSGEFHPTPATWRAWWNARRVKK